MKWLKVSYTSVAFYKYAHKIKKPVVVLLLYNSYLSGEYFGVIKDKIEIGFVIL